MLKLKKKVLKIAAQDINTIVSKFIHQEIFRSASYLHGNRVCNLFLTRTVYRENLQLLNLERKCKSKI